MHPPVAIIGAGRVGAAVGALLHRQGVPIAGVMRRTMAAAREAVRLIGAGTPTTDPVRAAEGAEVVFITVPDGEIQSMAAALGRGLTLDRRHLLVHTSGALPAAALRVPGTEGALHLSLHPIQTVADPLSGAEKLQGSVFGLEGEPEAVARGKELVALMRGIPVVIRPGQKPLYHAASCVASNYLVALAGASLDLYCLAGMTEEQALAAVRSLFEGALDNIRRLGVAGALTGPIERGDVETVRRHVEALDGIEDAAARERLGSLYRSLGLETLRVAGAKRQGLSPAHREIEALLGGAGAPTAAAGFQSEE
ncbi:MAG: DUF2520 domain-containing protein [Firmicutes bacterium]|nr:DUF2520 domain-containing protein [Bacillota bacterium]MBO2521658.1 DUF2520 domain-containing protein [Bacillota bacterium]